MSARFIPCSQAALVAGLVVALAIPVFAQETVVLVSPDEAIAWLESESWWGENRHGEDGDVPYAMITAISERWPQVAAALTVEQKKEVFYRMLLPLAMHANVMVLDRRERMGGMDERLAKGGALEADELGWLQGAAVLLRIVSEEEAAGLAESDPGRLREILAEALHRLDVIPPGLVLGQAAYESGYGTSRFATQGNALFGQWTFGGDGMVPEHQRSELGDHRIASYEWPFDSVRAYFLNLSSHPAYEDFRELRARLGKSGQPLSSLEMADGLMAYSERGQEYVDTLKGIIRVNDLDMADRARFRDEPMRFLVGADGEAEAEATRKELDEMRRSGELAKIVERMRLD